jgi:hypothetical protein
VAAPGAVSGVAGMDVQRSLGDTGFVAGVHLVEHTVESSGYRKII